MNDKREAKPREVPTSVCTHGPFVDAADEQQHKFHCEAPLATPWTPFVEVVRKEMMARFSDKLSMEEIASCAYALAEQAKPDLQTLSEPPKNVIAEVEHTLRDAAGQAASGAQVICGANPIVLPETTGGCGKSMPWMEAYRCVDCGVYFHKDCIKKHWGKVLTDADIERECGSHLAQPTPGFSVSGTDSAKSS